MLLSGRKMEVYVNALERGKGQDVLLKPDAIRHEGKSTFKDYRCTTRMRVRPVYHVSIQYIGNRIYGACDCEFGQFHFQRTSEKRICKHIAYAVLKEGLLAIQTSVA